MKTKRTTKWVWKGCLFIVVTAIIFAGCSQPPSPNDGKKIFHMDFDFRADGVLKLVSFNKKNGQKGEIKNREGMTVESYSMEYSAEVEAIQRCALSLDDAGFIYAWGETNGGFSLYADLQPEQVEYKSWVKNAIRMDSGQRCIIWGTIIFEKTEKGWSYNKSKADYLQAEP
jgi:hypothetical protein